MKFIISIVLIGLLALASGLFLPWWSVALASFLVAYVMKLRPGLAFLAGFVGVFLCWLIIAMIRDSANDGILSARISELFGIGGSAFLLVLISSLIGGLVAGLAALTASYSFSRQMDNV